MYKELQTADPELFGYIRDEHARQQAQIELIASENIVSVPVLQAAGSMLTNKYAEGYPKRRYYGGCAHVDDVEDLAIRRACSLFKCSYANVQPHCGSSANQAVFLALLKPGMRILGMDLAAGGHLSHGSRVNLSGKWFEAFFYGVDPVTHLIDLEKLRDRALACKPALIIAGGSAYSRPIDFAAFRSVADEVGAWLLVDMAHFAGLVAAGLYPDPFAHAHVCTTTTHKTLRGPRGGLILWNDSQLSKKLNSGVFPGLQGGPLMHVIAAKAVAFGEAQRPSFRRYAQAVIDNMQALADTLQEEGFSVISGGTDTHVALVDLRPFGVRGNVAEDILEKVGITCNKNSIPNDPEKPMVTSGLRLGSAAVTTRGFKVEDMREVGRLIGSVLRSVDAQQTQRDKVHAAARESVEKLTSAYPLDDPMRALVDGVQ